MMDRHGARVTEILTRVGSKVWGSDLNMAQVGSTILVLSVASLGLLLFQDYAY